MGKHIFRLCRQGGLVVKRIWRSGRVIGRVGIGDIGSKGDSKDY